jgi:hypothetical protein
MQTRNNLLLNLRPELGLPAASGEIEQFQNETLRPILKFQNELLLRLCQHQFTKRKGVYFQLSAAKKLEYIEQQVIRDKNFKNLLFGVIIGHLTTEEYTFFQQNESAFRKRLTSLLLQRLQDQYEKITPFSS